MMELLIIKFGWYFYLLLTVYFKEELYSDYTLTSVMYEENKL